MTRLAATAFLQVPKKACPEAGLLGRSPGAVVPQHGSAQNSPCLDPMSYVSTEAGLSIIVNHS